MDATQSTMLERATSALDSDVGIIVGVYVESAEVGSCVGDVGSGIEGAGEELPGIRVVVVMTFSTSHAPGWASQHSSLESKMNSENALSVT